MQVVQGWQFIVLISTIVLFMSSVNVTLLFFYLYSLIFNFIFVDDIFYFIGCSCGVQMIIPQTVFMLIAHFYLKCSM